MIETPDGVEVSLGQQNDRMAAVLRRTFQREPYNNPTASDIEGVKIKIEMYYLLHTRNMEDKAANTRMGELEKRFDEIKGDTTPKNFPFWKEGKTEDVVNSELFMCHLKTHTGELSDRDRAIAAYNNLALLDTLSTTHT